MSQRTLNKPLIPQRERVIDQVLRSMDRYYERGADCFLELSIPIVANKSLHLPLTGERIELPEWAKDLAVEGALLVPVEAVSTKAEGGSDWRQVDWWLACFLLIEGCHERLYEDQNGPIHSYSFRLAGWDSRFWERAWANRIFLFLRRWIAREKNFSEPDLFGALPKTGFLLTHDVDAVSKTLPIRLKQTAFCSFNLARSLLKGNGREAWSKTKGALRFLLGSEDWWKLDETMKLEEKYRLKSVFHFYGGSLKRGPKTWLFDPSYQVGASRVRDFIARSKEKGFSAGLHPGFDSWNSQQALAKAKSTVDEATGTSVRYIRQHWLRFSWADTWRLQSKAGLEIDSTLMYNDRPGFRNSAAIAWHPLESSEQSHRILALSSVLMDSHLYDYDLERRNTLRERIQKWIDEVAAVHGYAAVLWHPHTLSRDYDWAEGFETLLQTLTKHE